MPAWGSMSRILPSWAKARLAGPWGVPVPAPGSLASMGAPKTRVVSPPWSSAQGSLLLPDVREEV